MLKQLFVLLITSPFLAGALVVGLLLANWGSSTCTSEKTKAVTACEKSQRSGYVYDGDTAFKGCMEGYGFSHGLGTTFIVVSLFVATGIIVGFRNLLTFTGVTFPAMMVVGLVSDGRRR